MIKIEQCLNGYLLAVGDLRIVLSPEMYEELKTHFTGKELTPEEPVNKPPERKIKQARRAKAVKASGNITGWSKNYDKCRECGTTEKKHRGKGLCSTCFQRAERHKNKPVKNKKLINPNNISFTSGSCLNHLVCADCKSVFDSVLEPNEATCLYCGSDNLLKRKNE